MSNVNIRRAVENIRSVTTVYTPLIEVIVNAIQAIDEADREDGCIVIYVDRDAQVDLDANYLPDISGFIVKDNGVGFNEKNRNSFDTLYSDLKINQGGKGFGRFTCLKYFSDMRVESTFNDGHGFKQRKFLMGKDKDIIVNESIDSAEKSDTGSIIFLEGLNRKGFDKKLKTIARSLVERLLPYFISDDYTCPDIYLCEKDGSGKICLNDFVRNELSQQIQEIGSKNVFDIKAKDKIENFVVRLFKVYSPKNQKSKISLVAHKREVLGSAIHTYIPEFFEDFYDAADPEEDTQERNYIVKAYVFSDYLDRNVSLERGGFEFSMNDEMILGISQSDIEKRVAEIAKEAVGTDVKLRQNKKIERVQNYVDSEAFWHKEILQKIDLSDMPCSPTNEEIELRLQKEKFNQEISIRKKVNNILSNASFESVKEDAIEIVNAISETSKSDLVHYVAMRRKVLDIFDRSLALNEDGKYSSEGVVHDIIFPRKGSSEITSFKDHNLWILDERLNFTSYVSSDIPLDKSGKDRPDLLIYNNRVMFRGDNEASNPVTIFEFKKPQRDDFVNPSSNEDPVQQIVRYVNSIRAGKHKTPDGRKILVSASTQFYGYVVCDITSKVEEWLEFEKDFTKMPDGLGWFKWHSNINLYIELISWDKVLRDSTMRNKIFFEKLGISKL